MANSSIPQGIREWYMYEGYIIARLISKSSGDVTDTSVQRTAVLRITQEDAPAVGPEHLVLNRNDIHQQD